MLTKEYVKEVKENGNGDLKKLVDSKKDDKSIVFILENLGYLPDDFDESWVQDLLNSENKKIRLNAIKTLGKVKKENNITVLLEIAKNDKSTDVRREAVSSIGRMRSKKAIPALIEMLDDNDPKIISQAISPYVCTVAENTHKSKSFIFEVVITNKNPMTYAITKFGIKF